MLAQQQAERLDELHPGQRRPDAEVHAGPEGQVRVGVAVGTEGVGVVEDRRVAVRRAEQGRDPLPGLDGHVTDRDRLGRGALEELERRVEAEHLLDAGRHLARRRA